MPASLEAIRQDVRRGLGRNTDVDRTLGEMIRIRDRIDRGGLSHVERMESIKEFYGLAGSAMERLAGAGMDAAADNLQATKFDLVSEWRSAAPSPDYRDMSGGRAADPDMEFTGWL